MPSPPFGPDEYVMFVGNASFRSPAALLSASAPTSYTPFHTLPKNFILDSVVHYDIDTGVLPIGAFGDCKTTDSYTYRVYQCGSTQPIATFVGTMASGPTCEFFPDPKPVISACTPIYITVQLFRGGIVGDPYFTLYIREIL
jgi:hypothetical protein